MNVNRHTKLDNPVWYSLSESHEQVAVDYKTIKFYQPDYCPFGGFENSTGIAEHIDAYAALADNFFVVGEQPELSGNLEFIKELVCLQMVARGSIDIKTTEEIIQLTEGHNSILYDLVNLVQPGYFKRKTALLGNYFGIFKNNELVAVTGERMKMHDFTEVSAVVTHPKHTGKGYARQLTAHTANNIFSQKKTPFLHVAENNLAAIKLYEKSGFETRRKISFWNITKRHKV